MSTLSSVPGSTHGVEDERNVGHTVISVFLIGTLLPVRGLSSIISGLPSWPVNTIAAILLILIAVSYRPRWLISMPWLTFAAGVLWIVMLVPSALLQDDFAFRRAGSISVLFALAYVIGGGRLHLDSLRRGMLVGLVVAVAIGTVQLQAPSSYRGRLTGLLGDPNGFGFTLVALGLIIAQRMTRPRHLVFLWLFLAGSVWLTQSRTTMFALAVATLWVFFGRRLGRLTGIAALIGVSWLFQWVSDFAERKGWFVERLGSDSLRDRLAETERLMTDTAGWWGHGLGSAVADFDGVTLFFHNSYRALQTEAGLVGLVLLIVMGVALYWSFHKLPSNRRPVWAEGALIAAVICSMNIGYSLTSVPMAMAVGMYIAYHCLAREELAAEAAVGELEKPTS